MIWSDLLVPGVPVIEKAIRPLSCTWRCSYCCALFGKRELAQLNQFDLIVLLMISNTVQNAIIGNDNSVTGGLIGAADADGGQRLRRAVSLSPRTDRPRRGRQGVRRSIENGQVLKDNLDSELITVAELEAAAHRQGFETLEAVDSARSWSREGTWRSPGASRAAGAMRQHELDGAPRGDQAI